jgi:GNAT superfamily N-acetyltransferase
MGIKIIEVTTKKQLKEFIHLPAKIHQNHSNWIPPIYMDEWVFFDPKKNPLFGHCDYIRLLAFKDGQAVGRVMGLVNHKYNQSHNEEDARFSFMETYNDQEVANALIEAVHQWAKDKGMKNLVGPLSFSDKDPQGMMVEGFEQPLVIATNCNFPYQVNLLENMGFGKKVDLVTYKIDIPEVIPDLYQKIYERRLVANNIHVIEFKTRKAIKPYIIPVLELLNETFKDIYAFAPMERPEMEKFADRYLSLLNPRFIKIIENQNNELVAFIITMPDLSPGIIKSKGYLLPFGIFYILNAQKKTNQLNLLLGGIRSDFRDTGLDAVLGVKLLNEAHATNLKYIDSHLVLETNTKMRAELERLGGYVYKRYRIFTKPLHH